MNALTNLKCTLALSAGFCSSFANAQKQPHIILIMTDQQRGDAVAFHASSIINAFLFFFKDRKSTRLNSSHNA